MTQVFEPTTLAGTPLANRLVMAPMTRSRAGVGGVPTALTATYYAQRASAGLIVTEATQPSPTGQGYFDTPGLHAPAQVAGWRPVVDAVHAEGGRIVAQLMHVGRIAHPDNKAGLETVAPSAIAAPGAIFTRSGMQPHPVPRALETDEIGGVVADFAQAAANAIAAGFDGVELHGANGYLLHEFLVPSANQRSDRYGGSPEARVRFPLEVAAAVADTIGPERLGYRISPANGAGGLVEDDHDDLAATYGALADGFADLGLGYLHQTWNDDVADVLRDVRQRFGGPVMVNDSSVTSPEAAQALLDDGRADLVSVGRAFLANPDLVRRWQLGAPLNEPDPATFYGGDERGYTDYPTLDETDAIAS
ncbi:alkene reductase [Nitriliruptor alkaliphilus]|uniref:alkene reductase n=1 Tax=Nitriliruptor alkaliphilus TaxID=427918 RepID=UPI0009FA1131|nr:alkene reductase [Nitriliruptor alkaliphilus]